MMKAWADYLDTLKAGAQVISIKRGEAKLADRIIENKQEENNILFDPHRDGVGGRQIPTAAPEAALAQTPVRRHQDPDQLPVL